MSTSDAPAPGTSDPIPIPGAGTNYSYWVVTRLEVVTTAPDNGINNIKWYSEGTSFGTGLVCSGNEATDYTQATGTQGTTGTELTVGNYTTGTLTTPVDVTTFTSGSPKSLAGSIGAATGEFGSRFVYQLGVGATAGVGTMTARTFTWQFDET